MGKTTVKTQTTENTAAQQEEKKTLRKKKTVAEKKHDAAEAAKTAAGKAGSGIKKGTGMVLRGARKGAIDIASLGFAVVAGEAVNTAANNLVVKGAAISNSTFNALTGRGTVNVKTRFGGWKTMSLADYTAAVNRGVKFKDAEANFFVNRHAAEINKAAKVVGGVAGSTAGVGTFIGSREALTKATRTRKERATDEMINRQNMAAILEESMNAYYGYDSSSSDYDDDFFEDGEE